MKLPAVETHEPDFASNGSPCKRRMSRQQVEAISGCHPERSEGSRIDSIDHAH